MRICNDCLAKNPVIGDPERKTIQWLGMCDDCGLPKDSGHTFALAPFRKYGKAKIIECAPESKPIVRNRDYWLEKQIEFFGHIYAQLISDKQSLRSNLRCAELAMEYSETLADMWEGTLERDPLYREQIDGMTNPIKASNHG